MVLSGNYGSELVNLRTATINDSLLTGNQTTNRLIEAQTLAINDSTIAGNVIDDAHVIGVTSSAFVPPSITSSIIWQPGKSTLSYSGSTNPTGIHDILASEVPTLVSVGGTRILNADPRFVDTAHGDYSLTAASPAVDFAAEVPGTDVDLIGHTRDIDLDVVPNRYGPRDLGALEREAVQPLVQNANFDVDLRLWNLWDPSSSTWDATHNIVGSAGSGSLRMAFADSSPGQTIHPRVQCVHIPGPGTYRLNGWGQSAGPTSPQRDRVSVLWHYRRFGNGSEDCFAGAVDQLGEFTITTGTTWVESVNPAYISVPASEWTSYSTLLIFPGATERGFGGGVSENILGWIDGITLDLETDIIFANGFDG